MVEASATRIDQVILARTFRRHALRLEFLLRYLYEIKRRTITSSIIRCPIFVTKNQASIPVCKLTTQKQVQYDGSLRFGIWHIRCPFLFDVWIRFALLRRPHWPKRYRK